MNTFKPTRHSLFWSVALSAAAFLFGTAQALAAAPSLRPIIIVDDLRPLIIVDDLRPIIVVDNLRPIIVVDNLRITDNVTPVVE